MLITLLAYYSAESYVDEPGDLWSAGLPLSLRDQAFRLVPTDDAGLRWVQPDGRPMTELDDPARTTSEGTTPASMQAMLDRDTVGGAVLYPSATALAYSAFADSELLSAVLNTYNEWVLGLAAADPRRLKALAVLNIDDPADCARDMRRWAGRGAAGFVLPCAPGEGRRYDQRRYEVLWRTAADLGRPVSLLMGTGRAPGRRSANTTGQGTDGAAAPSAEATPTAAAVLAFHATSVFPTRRSLTAIIFAGVFERYPALRIGAVGFGAGWAAYAMVRADEMYEVRPERAGPPMRVPASIRSPADDVDAEIGAIAGGERSGTRGMAPEGVGYYFPPGERFSDHFRRHVFLTFRKDELALSVPEFINADMLLWGQGRRSAGAEPADTARRDEFLAGVAEGDRAKLTRDNTARLYGFDVTAA